jgi:hypothetical protein
LASTPHWQNYGQRRFLIEPQSTLPTKLAGFKKLDIVNLAGTTNARDGPGIVLASVTSDAGIINTTLVLTAILTSQAAGLWLYFVLSKGWSLLLTDPDDKPIKGSVGQVATHV